MNMYFGVASVGCNFSQSDLQIDVVFVPRAVLGSCVDELQIFLTLRFYCCFFA